MLKSHELLGFMSPALGGEIPEFVFEADKSLLLEREACEELAKINKISVTTIG